MEGLYATQGGGIATFNGVCFVWKEMPDWCPEGSDEIGRLGDPIPSEWGTAAINHEASDEMDRSWPET